ncbi:MAG TPA: NACHT domain-containing protein, partial [Chloroflexaceae bacterium]|nr:NACHT domain-containing protein [Chloroflexaceae bacterium]
MSAPVQGAPPAPFASLDELRARHEALLDSAQAPAGLDGAAADLADFLARARASGALLDSRADRRAAQSILDYWVTQLYRADRPPLDGTLDPFDPARAPRLPDSLCPYVGLGAFVEEQHSLFFGRRRLVQQLVERIGRRRVLVLVGESGSGKSSLARAGLIPALRAGAHPGSADWHYLPPLLPGSNPLANLARLLLAQKTARPEPHVAAHARALAADPAHLARMVAQISDRPTLLLVDQFEELFTLCRDEAQRRAFVNCLLRLVAGPGSANRLVLTMRSDFETNVAKIPLLQRVFESARVQVTPLTAAELREAIEEPARRGGLRFADGIVDALVRDTLGEVAALPLLQATLLQLWRARDRNRVTLAAFQRVGGGREALARAADAFYAGLPTEQKITARRVLLRMVRPAGPGYAGGVRSEGLEVTSNRIRRRDLLSLGEDPSRVELVVDKLVAAGLVRRTPGDAPEDEQVEVAHEALVRNWPTLVGWIDEERERLRKRLRLSDEARRWLEADRRPDLLWRGEQLHEAMRSARDLTGEERSFLAASLLAEEQERERERQAREAVLEAERQRAEAEGQRAEAEAERAEAERIRAETRERERDILRRRARALSLLVFATALLGLAALAAGLYINSQRGQLAQELGLARITVTAIAGAYETAAINQDNAEAARVVAQTQEADARASAAEAQTARAQAQTQEADAQTARAQAQTQE